MAFNKLIKKLYQKSTRLLISAFILLFSVIFLLTGYNLDITANSELVTYRFFLSNPENIIGTYHHWLPNFIGAIVINLSGRYSILILRLLGFVVIIINCFFLYKILTAFFNKSISTVSIFLSLFFILRNYTILNSSLITGLFYMMFIFFIVQALKLHKDYFFFLAGTCLSLIYFSDCQNILCLGCVLGIFIYYKIASIPNSIQNKQFIPLTSGIFLTSVIIFAVMKLFDQLNYYMCSVENSYNLFQNSVGIYSNTNILKCLISLPYSYAYWMLLIIVLFFIAAKLVNLIKKKFVFAAGIIIVSLTSAYLISTNWEFIYIGLSFAVLLLYSFNILKCNNELRLICILAFIMEFLLGMGILRDNATIVYGIWIGLTLVFIVSTNLILGNYNISVCTKEEASFIKFNIKRNDYSFILISLFVVYILCSTKTLYSNFSLLSWSSSSFFSNENYINCQIEHSPELKELNSLANCINKYKNSSDFMITENMLNILYFTTNKVPLLGYTIYDDTSVPVDIQINNNIDINHAYPVIVLKKSTAHNTFNSHVTEFIKSNNYKSVYESNYYEIFIPITMIKK